METNTTTYAYPQVDIRFMNETHAEEVDLVGQLADLIKHRQSKESNVQATEIGQLLDTWLKHTSAHFERENALMLEVEFPARQMHMAEHKQALQLLKTVVAGWQQNQDDDSLMQYVMQTWPNWFKNHVSTMDMITAHYAVMQGFDPEATVSW